MRIFWKLFDFYINCSIHVAFSCFALVKLTEYIFSINATNNVSNFAFFGTIIGYNFIKYNALALSKNHLMSKELKAIAVVSFLSFLSACYYFFQFQISTKLIGFIYLITTILYALPFFPNKKNARNFKGIKIFVVAFCWVGVTVILPFVESNLEITPDFYLKCIQRYVLIFGLILIFEIIDLQTDDLYLQTVPQKIGVKRTKIIGIFLLLLFYFLEFLNSNFNSLQLFINAILIVVTSLFLLFANERKSKYYTSFWVESIPIFWYFLLLIFR